VSRDPVSLALEVQVEVSYCQQLSNVCGVAGKAAFFFSFFFSYLSLSFARL
jgi:hypothetical protein